MENGLLQAVNTVAYRRTILHWRQSGHLYNVWCISKHDGVTHVNITKVDVKLITPNCKVADIVDGECARKGEGDGPVCVGPERFSAGGYGDSEIGIIYGQFTFQIEHHITAPMAK